LESRVLADPVLVGRERELKELQILLDSVVKGKGKTVFVSGEAGTGKTRLVREFLSSVKHEKEIITLTGWCLSDACVPYFPFKEVFKAYFSTFTAKDDSANPQRSATANPQEEELSKAEETELKVWISGSTSSGNLGKFEGLAPQAWKDLTFATVTKTLFSLSTKKPTILFIDDVHWADSASLALLHYISRAITTQRILILAAFRNEELNPDEEGRPHPSLILYV